ncbi:MAG: ABC transporter ATP-binding protein [Planctomycetes bacterium]|nr:ABC transporter ATP-binding protein [Planctomycetota bacterium]MCB9826031.1 ABC transporter ATP-binding protein [Planctomycetota bacterium]MCB9829213.1 ABC transporter ATP-binding protein [Planctomycetota bacterium]
MPRPERGETMVRLDGVTKIYTKGGVELVVLDRLDLDVKAGSFVALMGPSGSGKSTILNLVGGLDIPDEGSVTVGGVDVDALSPDELSAWRAANVAYVFQAFNLIPVLTAEENVELPLLLTPLSRAQRREQARFALEIVGLADRMDHRPKQLSGGQEQRVAIARALAMDPEVMLCDEPTGDLDRASADQVLGLLRRLVDEHGKTILMVTHDPQAGEVADRIVKLDKGTVLVEGAEA